MKWTQAVSKTLDALNTEFPEIIMCTHHGVLVEGHDLEEMEIHITPRGKGTLVMVYHEHRTQGRTSAQYKQWREDIASDCGTITDHWNGSDGSSGVSYVLDLPPPPALVRATERYRRLPIDSVFNMTPEQKAQFRAFDDTLAEALKQ